MEFNEIKRKKPIYPIGPALERYLEKHGRTVPLPIHYADLLRYDGLMPQLDAEGKETLWNTVLLRPSDQAEMHERLVDIYQLLTASGRRTAHLNVASIDFCIYGNSQPFRIKIHNQINDNHDYYYVKQADASRVYGLELEHLLSPHKIEYMYGERTLVEEHIIGVPGDTFMRNARLYDANLNEVRLSKEFVKFNERCFARLLGDMRAYNFVVDMIQDFDQVQYRIRSIDFDQQCYEGRYRIYLPQFYKENLPYVRFAEKYISNATAEQYRNEERSLLRKRYKLGEEQINDLLSVMKEDPISPEEYVVSLREDLAKHHADEDFMSCTSMGAILELHLKCMLGMK